MRKKIYIAGPYTKGDVVQNVVNAIRAADTLLEYGYTPFIPHLYHFWHFHSPKEYTVWLELDLEWLEVCDAVLRLPGESSGADAEVATAEKEMPIFYSIEEILDYF